MVAYIFGRTPGVVDTRVKVPTHEAGAGVKMRQGAFAQLSG
jgi:hypothetical protein